MLEGKTIAVLGAGRLGQALIRGLLDAGAVTPDHVTVTTGHADSVAAISQRLGVHPARTNADAVRNADLVILAVKPQTLAAVLQEIDPVLRENQVLISCVASVGTPFIETHLRTAVPVIRAMPNTPAMLKKGMTGLSAGRHAGEQHVALARTVFDSVGRTVVLDEKHMNAVTGLSASGPAFIYIVIESLAEAGVKIGLPRDVATELAAQTVAGAGEMVLLTGEHPARLKDLVTTPAGCTIDGILELEDGGLRVTLIKAVVRATERAKQLHEG
jgi:pyrroline-5-carboxylate reductase